jgi:hypothetical protein
MTAHATLTVEDYMCLSYLALVSILRRCCLSHLSRDQLERTAITLRSDSTQSLAQRLWTRSLRSRSARMVSGGAPMASARARTSHRRGRWRRMWVRPPDYRERALRSRPSSPRVAMLLSKA